ncbi:MAG: hypothetical protein M3552_03405 [Planctomycetota bacterium]|nr:hypothetical protein [Planctomycetota bacterium]
MRVIAYALFNEAVARGARRASPVGRERIYDPYSLAIRPLPADLRLFPHPRRLSSEDVRRILGG